MEPAARFHPVNPIGSRFWTMLLQGCTPFEPKTVRPRGLWFNESNEAFRFEDVYLFSNLLIVPLVEYPTFGYLGVAEHPERHRWLE